MHGCFALRSTAASGEVASAMIIWAVGVGAITAFLRLTFATGSNEPARLGGTEASSIGMVAVAHMGRLYIPREALAEARISTTDPHEVAADPKRSIACAEVAVRARDHFVRSDAIRQDAAFPVARTASHVGRLPVDARQNGCARLWVAERPRGAQSPACSRRPRPL